MIFLITVVFPPNKAKEVAEKFFKSAEQPLPPAIKKWETYLSDDGLNGLKGYHLIKTERDKVEEAAEIIRQLFAPMLTIEGFRSKTETLIGMKDMAKLMKLMK